MDGSFTGFSQTIDSMAKSSRAFQDMQLRLSGTQLYFTCMSGAHPCAMTELWILGPSSMQCNLTTAKKPDAILLA